MRKLKTKKSKYFIYSLFSLIIISSLILGIPRLIKILEVVCRSQFGPCSGEMVAELNQVMGSDLPSTKKKLSAFLMNNLSVEKYSMFFKFPNKIEVNLVIRKPYYALKAKDNNYLVAKDGLIMAKSGSSSLPSVEINQDFKIGEKVPPDVLFALKLVSDINPLYYLRSSKLESDNLTVELKTGTKAIFPLEGDAKVLIGALRLLIEQLNSSYEKFRIEKSVSQIVIDLRYKNPVIR